MEGQGRLNSRSPVALTADLMEGVAPQWWGKWTECEWSVTKATGSHRCLHMGMHPSRVSSSGAQVGRTAQESTGGVSHKISMCVQ